MKFAHSAVAIRLPLSVVVATLGAKSESSAGVLDVIGPMRDSWRSADGSLAGSRGELAEELRAGPHFVGQRASRPC